MPRIDTEEPDIIYEEEIELDEETKAKILPPYHVILQNDDHHSMQFVLTVLIKVFGYDQERCYQLMLLAHETGLAVVWTGSKEVAELKLEQIQTCKEGKFGSLGAYIEASV